MSLSDLFELLLKFVDKFRFGCLNLVETLLDISKSTGIEICCLESLVKLKILELEVVLDGGDLFLENEIFESGFLLNLVNSLVKLFVESVSLPLEVLEVLEFYLPLVLELAVLDLQLEIYLGDFLLF